MILKGIQILFLLACWKVSAQNYILNGDFEMYDECPMHPSYDFAMEIEHCLGWYSPTTGTSDYLNACHAGNPNVYTNVGVPYNFMGFQPARSGNGYLGLYVYQDYLNGKEYVQSRLVQPLLKDSIYHVVFYLSLADSAEYGIEGLGAYFSRIPVTRNDFWPIKVTPQVSCGTSVLIDTAGWMKVEGYIIGIDNEEYITIGSFKDSSDVISMKVNSSTWSTGKGASYYYIDDVSVIPVELHCEFPNVFTPNGDGINDYFSPINITLPGWELSIYNRWGLNITQLNEHNPHWNGMFGKSHASPGVYFYVLSSSHIPFKKTGFFHLMTN